MLFTGKRKMNWLLKLILIFIFSGYASVLKAADTPYKSIRDFNVLASNSPAENTKNLQNAIEWAAKRGAALFVEPSETPYPMNGGITLLKNVSLVGVHGPVGRGTRHPEKLQPVGSVFRIIDEEHVFITVETATQIRGLQFWYPNQTVDNPEKIIPYPATIRVSQTKPAQGVTLSCLTFYGEYTAMDFEASRKAPCEQILFEHCYGYPLSGEFIKINYCYDIPRILHCHVNPANRRFIEGQYSPKIVDSVIARKTYTYTINHTDNAQLLDVFTFGAYGGIFLGPATYGQMTNFNFDCVTIGIHKFGNSSKNRNWQIAQGSIIANTGDEINHVHPIVIEGKGHTSLTNVEAFSGPNAALSTLNKSLDFLLVKGKEKLTVSLFGCRMRNYLADDPITNLNPNATIQAVACINKNEKRYELIIEPD